MLDDLVGNIIEKLKNTGLYDNTIFVFSSDNGGMASAQVGNYPYRGISFDNIVISSVLFDLLMSRKMMNIALSTLIKYV